MSQIALPLAWPTADGEADFFVSDANEAAVAWLDRWPDWPRPATLLVGPAGAGKSHLARIFQRRHDAVVVADADRSRDEEALFHAWNAAGARPLLITARTPPRDWGVRLPDLASRLAATPVVHIGLPDEPLLAAVMAKQFRDRGVAVAPELVAWVLARSERSFEAVARAVALLDAAALERGRAITVPLARQVLDGQLDWIDAR